MFLNSHFQNLEISELRKFTDKAPANSINMGLGEIRLPIHPKIKEYLIKLIKTETFNYTPNAGLSDLRDMIKNDYPNSEVCVTCGAEEAIFATLFSVLSPNDEVLIANPGYLAYKTIIELCKAKPVYFNLNLYPEFTLDKKSLLQSITKKTKAIIISNPSNPVGKILNSKDLEFIKRITYENNILLIVDEIYRELFIKSPIKSAYDTLPNILIISGISKAFAMAGWRLGWAVSFNKKLISGITVAHQYIATNAPTISQKIAIKILSEKKFFLDYYRNILKSRYNLFSNLLSNSFPFIEPDAAPYLFINFSQDDYQLAKELSNKGLLAIPGSFFGNNAKGWIRFNYAIDENKLKQAIEIIIEN